MPSQSNTQPLGRPPLPEGEVRQSYIKVRVSEDDKMAFIAACNTNAQNPSAVIRLLMDHYIECGGFS